MAALDTHHVRVLGHGSVKESRREAQDVLRKLNVTRAPVYDILRNCRLSQWSMVTP
jgi:hypothetical protein